MVFISVISLSKANTKIPQNNFSKLFWLGYLIWKYDWKAKCLTQKQLSQETPPSVTHLAEWVFTHVVKVSLFPLKKQNTKPHKTIQYNLTVLDIYI